MGGPPDYIRLNADQIRNFVPQPYVVLGTDGYGRSDTRKQLRHFFEVDHRYIIVAALKALVDQGEIPAAKVVEAMKKYGLDPEKADPVQV
jgi:pyruvate dehydrogenase E1 component